MPRIPHPAALLTAAFALAVMLALTACSGARPAAPPAIGTGLGSILAYEVTSNGQAYPFVVSVRQNDAEGIAFGYDLGDGTQTGSVQMSAEAMESATAMHNSFGSSGYRLTDKTSVWLARGPFARLRAGETVVLDLGTGPGEAFDFSGGCGETFDIGTAGGGTYAVPACRFTFSDLWLVVADDAEQPVILSMETGLFTVTLETAAKK